MLDPIPRRQLYTTLAKLYEKERDARRIATDVGLRVEAIAFGDSALNFWSDVVDECAKEHRLEQLLALVREEYPRGLPLDAFALGRAQIWSPPLDEVVPVIELREREKKREVQITPHTLPAPFEAAVKVTWREGARSDAYLLTVLSRSPDCDTLAACAGHCAAWKSAGGHTDWCWLLYPGDPCDVALKQSASKHHVELLGVAEFFDRLVDLRGYITRQTRQLATSAEYLPAMYIPQRAVLQVGRDARIDDALAEVRSTIDKPARQLVVVLGDFGTGKTFLLHKLAHQLGTEIDAGQRDVPIPLLIEMRDLHKAATLDELLAQHLVRRKVEHVNIPALRHMIRQGRVVLFFDGFDELALRLTYDRAAQHLDTVLEAVEERARVVLTSRVQHFRNTEQLRTALSKKLDQVAHRTLRLEKFEPDQIRRFFANTLQHPIDAPEVEERMDLLHRVDDLSDLGRTPRMLSFIARLPVEQLRAAAEGDRTITSAKHLRDAGRGRVDHPRARARGSAGLPEEHVARAAPGGGGTPRAAALDADRADGVARRPARGGAGGARGGAATREGCRGRHLPGGLGEPAQPRG